MYALKFLGLKVFFMVKKRSKASADIFNAVSAPIRIQTLRLLANRGPLTYSEIMEMLNLEPTKDAGKFVYHLKNLVNTGLIAFDKTIKKYKVTELGLMVINFSQDLEEYALKKAGRMLVRTSRYTIEEFDRSKITMSLIEEAGLTPEVAEKISSEVEERLLKLPIKYLTAPLIREFVNAVLIESGLEEYRHKLTRLGMPVHDVKKTVEEASKKGFNVKHVCLSAGRRVITEYMLLTSLPREVADAHLSGQIHICDSGSWILSPSSIYHDLRAFFCEKGFQPNPYMPNLTKPKNFFDAVSVTATLLNSFQSEVSKEQVVDYFNVFLAPFLARKTVEEVKKVLKNFLLEVSSVGFENSGGVTFGVEVEVPPHLKDSRVTGVEEKLSYGDFEDETQKILDLLLDVFLDLSEKKPLFNPQLVLKFRSECFTDKHDWLLEKAHRLAAEYGTLYIANLTRDNVVSSFAVTGERVETDWTGDWEIDTLRVGCLNNVSINLPRIAYEAKKDDTKLFNGIDRVLDFACKALEVKRREMENRFRENLLPNLSQNVEGENYFRLKDSVGTVSVLGLNEAVKSHLGYELYEDLMPQHFAVKLVEYLTDSVKKFSEKTGLRLNVSQVSDVEASQRLATYDVWRYGWSTVNVQGGKETPYYTFLASTPENLKISLDEKLKLEEKLHPLFRGGAITKIMVEKEASSEQLLKRTKKICGEYNIGFFVYDHVLGWCNRCKKNFKGFKQKCPSCSSTNITIYARESTRYIPLNWWTHPGLKNLLKGS
ncbi:MAG: hypothetical protein DRO36_02805 [Candidatus Hecatellales archaeon]|nr:MAG: hypothetical protein DRO36_02805 [Candidatus Hecatellales archaeon]